MLKSLRLQNFRGFSDHTVELTSFCILMGQNNAGKTTIIEALRIVGLAQAKAARANFTVAPDSFAPDLTGAVYRVSLASIGFEHETVHHRYISHNPAIITATLSNNCKIKVVIGEENSDVFCQLYEKGEKKVIARRVSENPKFGSVLVMPPVGHLLAHEAPITEEYMRQNSIGFRAHRHLRNQMFRNPDGFQEFKKIAEDSWHLLQIGQFDLVSSERGQEYRLQVRDGPFVSEIGQQGSGLQAWIQTLWFVNNISKNSTLVLDEPDVYLHADLQRKLLKILGSLGFKQIIVATHSVEMISDVSYEEVIVVKKRERHSRPLKSMDELQKASESIGSMHNLQLSKISTDGNILFVEGKDKAFLSEIAYKITPRVYDKLIALPTFAVGGFDNWPRAALTALAFDRSSSGRIAATILLDRDYKDTNYIEQVVNEANKSKLKVKVWNRKEIENYFIVPSAFARIVYNATGNVVDAIEIERILADITQEGNYPLASG